MVRTYQPKKRQRAKVFAKGKNACTALHAPSRLAPGPYNVHLTFQRSRDGKIPV